jgi:hypothetical protein
VCAPAAAGAARPASRASSPATAVRGRHRPPAPARSRPHPRPGPACAQPPARVAHVPSMPSMASGRRAHRGSRHRARWTGSRSPGTRARLIATPVTPVRSVSPWGNGTCLWGRACCLGCIGTPRAPQPTTRLPGRQPRASLVALAPRHLLQVARRHAVPLASSRLQHLVNGHPLHPGRRQRHRGDAAAGQPLRQRPAVRGNAAARPHRWGVSVLGPTRPDRLTADVQAGGVRGHTGARGVSGACGQGMTSDLSGNGEGQTRSGRFADPGATGASPSPSEATTPHRTPDQHPSRPRAGLPPRCARSSLVWPARRRIAHWHQGCCPHAYRIAVWPSRHH